MKSLFIRFFFANWQRKLISLVLAIAIWILVNHSMTITKTIHGVSVRVTNLPVEKTIEGMQSNGTLMKKISLTITGTKSILEDLTARDLEAIIDADGKNEEWIAAIEKKHLISLNPEYDFQKGISKVVPVEMIVRQSKRISEKIPVLITHPIGEPPKGYQFLDIWPYQLSLTVNGPEEVVKKVKARGLKLTFNLSDISKRELDTLAGNKKVGDADEVSFFVPNAWKKVTIPQLSETPLEIDDALAKTLRIDFSRQDLLSIGVPIPITVFFPPKYSDTLNPETYKLAANDFIVKQNGIKLIQTPLYAQGVSRLFLDTVKDMIQLVVVAVPKSEQDTLLWNIQFMYPYELENRYVAKVLSESNDELADVQPRLREDYLRNRFRSYMNRFRLYTQDRKKLALKIELEADAISVTPAP